MVSQEAPRIERYRRLASGGWAYEEVTSGLLELDCGAGLDPDRLYADLPD